VLEYAVAETERKFDTSAGPHKRLSRFRPEGRVMGNEPQWASALPILQLASVRERALNGTQMRGRSP
jgi:hypothetical protein